MPYKSTSQQGWAHTPAGTKALGGEDKVAEWDESSKGKDLPDHVTPKDHPLHKLKRKPKK
jgi:hypothetical protein